MENKAQGMTVEEFKKLEPCWLGDPEKVRLLAIYGKRKERWTAFEKQPPARTIRKGGGYISYRFMASTAGTQYDSCRVSYTDPATGKVVEGTAKSEDYDEEAKNHKQLEITAKTASPGEAKALAENHLRMHNKFARTASFTLPGDPLLLAGQTVRVAGWAAFDGEYLVSRAVHTLGPDGYITDVELQKVLGV